MKPSNGQLIKWNDDRGFGFIKPNTGGKEVFLHISAVRSAARRPKVGDTIFYEQVTGGDGKTRATNASIQGVDSQSLSAQRSYHTTTRSKTKGSRLLETILSLSGVAVFTFLGLQLISRTLSMKPGCNIKGNISIDTGNKLYHTPGMEDYFGTVISPEKGERWFCSESEAIAAGWRKAPR
jgi:cold shock CspA family protein